jgi:hypothetical protein
MKLFKRVRELIRGGRVIEQESLEEAVDPEFDNVAEFELDTEIVDNPNHKAFYKSLEEEEIMLLTLRDELYNSSWKKMEKDLNDRLKGRPYIKKLFTRINEELSRIEKMRGYEQEHSVNLANYKDENTK